MDAAKDIVRKEGAGHPSDMAADMRFRVLLGEEAWARLPEQVRAHCDDIVRVPIVGKAESLNLAMAATVCLYASAGALTFGT